MFTRLDGNGVVWPDGTRERVDAVILATGYRPDLGYLAPTGALDPDGRPLHRGGVSATVPGVGYVGLDYQRAIASATVRGVGRAARYVTRRLIAQRAGAASGPRLRARRGRCCAALAR